MLYARKPALAFALGYCGAQGARSARSVNIAQGRRFGLDPAAILIFDRRCRRVIYNGAQDHDRYAERRRIKACKPEAGSSKKPRQAHAACIPNREWFE